jgi:hypothetical protein
MPRCKAPELKLLARRAELPGKEVFFFNAPLNPA